MKTTSTILGISPGTRITGLALMRDGNLIDWKVKTFKGYWSRTKLKDITHFLKTYLVDYEVEKIVLKKPDVYRTSTGLGELISELRIICNQFKIPFAMFSLKGMKSWYEQDGFISKADMIKQAMTKYPEVYPEYNKEQRLRNGYYLKSFEAIILAGKPNL